MIVYIPLPEIFLVLMVGVFIIIFLIGVIRVLTRVNRKPAYLLIGIAVLGLLICKGCDKIIKGEIFEPDYFYTNEMLSPDPGFINKFEQLEETIKNINLKNALDTLVQSSNVFPYAKIDSKCYPINGDYKNMLMKTASTSALRSILLCTDSTFIFKLNTYWSPKNISIAYQSYFTRHEIYFNESEQFNFKKNSFYKKNLLEVINEGPWNYRIIKDERWR